MPEGTSEDVEIETVKARFWSKVSIGAPDDCWEWQASKNLQGYGQFSINYRNYLSHRVSYMFAHGEFDQNLICCHICDNPGCVNPGHLFIGTQKDNAMDRAKKGRSANQKKTHCLNGHELATNTSFFKSDGNKRVCRVCHNERSKIASRKYYARKKARQ